MADIKIMKAVEFDKLPAAFKKWHAGGLPALRDAGYILQRKYDGCFAKVTLAFDRAKCKVESRTGEVVRSMDHIINELHDTLCEKYGSWDDVVVLGEAWRPISEATFPESCGQFRRHNPEPTLHFVINDMVPVEMNTTVPYRDRIKDVFNAFGGVALAPFKAYPAETHFKWPYDPAEIALKWQGEGGFDGAVMRNPDMGYTVGLVKKGEIIKVKPTLSLDLRCTELTEVVGEKTGRAVFTITVVYRGVRTEVGSGMPHSFDALPKLGQIVEIECIGLTADGKLREPRFKGIRHDKEEADK